MSQPARALATDPSRDNLEPDLAPWKAAGPLRMAVFEDARRAYGDIDTRRLVLIFNNRVRCGHVRARACMAADRCPVHQWSLTDHTMGLHCVWKYRRVRPRTVMASVYAPGGHSSKITHGQMALMTSMISGCMPGSMPSIVRPAIKAPCL
jgi:hypothetical protein